MIVIAQLWPYITQLIFLLVSSVCGGCGTCECSDTLALNFPGPAASSWQWREGESTSGAVPAVPRWHPGLLRDRAARQCRPGPTDGVWKCGKHSSQPPTQADVTSFSKQTVISCHSCTSYKYIIIKLYMACLRGRVNWVAKEIDKMGNRVPKLRPREAEDLARATHCERPVVTIWLV